MKIAGLLSVLGCCTFTWWFLHDVEYPHHLQMTGPACNKQGGAAVLLSLQPLLILRRAELIMVNTFHARHAFVNALLGLLLDFCRTTRIWSIR
jgi:hypothetical protein